MIGSAATEVNSGGAWRNHRLLSPFGARAILRGCPGRYGTQPPRSPSSLKRSSAAHGRFRPPKHDRSAWIVTDYWPERVPVTDTEVELFERWFADLFDEPFGPAP